MKKLNQHIEIVRGDDLTVTFVVNEADDSAKDLTGAVIAAMFEDSDGTLKITKTSAAATEIDITAPTAGTFELYLEPGDTSGLDAAEYPYDVEVTLGGKVVTVASGRLFVLEDYTT